MNFHLWARKLRTGRTVYYWKLPEEKSWRSTGLSNQRKARHYVESLLQEGKHVRETLEGFTGEFFIWDRCQWIAEQHATGHSFSKGTAAMRRGHLDNYILPEFGRTKLIELNARDIQRWLISLPLSNQTLNHIKHTFNIVLNEARRALLLQRNPIDDVKPMADKHAERKPFTLEELKLLFPADREELLRIWGSSFWASLFYLMLTSGMRSGEIRAFQWKHVNWDLKGVMILQAVKQDGTIGETKAGEQRAALVPERTLDLLSWWRDESPWPAEENLTYHGIGGGNRVLQRGSISKKFKPALIRAGVPPQGRTPHCLRHTYNDRMRKLLPEEILRYMIGHKSRAMTDHYSHPTPESKLEEFLPHRKSIDGAWN